MEKNLTFWGNGMLIDETKKQTLTNAHLYYRGMSVIVDYEKILHVYSDEILKNKTLIPFEMYPYDESVYMGFLSVNNKFKKVDISELIKEIDEAIERLNK